MKKNLSLVSLITLILTLSIPIQAATVAYWRMGDDTSNLTDSSGNDNHITAGAGADYTLPASGVGSSFFDPIPQTGSTNSKAVDLNGSSGGDRFYAPDIINSSLDFTVEAMFNVEASISRTQYVVSQYQSPGSSNRGWAIGVAASGGTGGAAANELFLLASDTGASGSLIPLGLIVDTGTDYYIGVGFDNTSNTNDIHFYYQDLTNSGTLQSNTISSGIVNLHNTTVNIEIGAFDVDSSNFGGLIDEVRISSGVLASNELLAIPEPGSFILVALGFVSILVFSKRK